MEQAVRAASMVAPVGEACPVLTPPHLWSVDPRTRAHIDWTRGTLMELADDFMTFTPREMRLIMMSAIDYIDAIMPRLAIPADRQQMLVARMMVASTRDNYASLSLDEITAEMMAACRVLLTGTDYQDMDAPEDLIRGRA